MIVRGKRRSSVVRFPTVNQAGRSDVSLHAIQHQADGLDELSVEGLAGILQDAQYPMLHANTHENGGVDEMSVAGLSGLLADPQTAAAHSHPESDVTGLVSDLSAIATALAGKAASSHTHAEADVTGLVADLAARALTTDARFTDARTPTAHASSHMGGSDPLVAIGASVYQTVAQSGLANSAQTAMVYDGVNFNTNGIYNVANKTRLTAPRTGVYLIVASAAPLGGGIVSPLASFIVLKINNDPTKQIAVSSGAMDGSQNSACVVSAIYKMTVNDYVEAYVRIRGTSGTWGSSGNSLESFSMVWLGD